MGHDEITPFDRLMADRLRELIKEGDELEAAQTQMELLRLQRAHAVANREFMTQVLRSQDGKQIGPLPEMVQQPSRNGFLTLQQRRAARGGSVKERSEGYQSIAERKAAARENDRTERMR